MRDTMNVEPDHQVAPPRQCGRCRLTFEADPTLDPNVQAEWWLCPPCRAALLGDKTAGVV